VPRILWWDSGSGLEARQRKARHGLLYSLFQTLIAATASRQRPNAAAASRAALTQTEAHAGVRCLHSPPMPRAPIDAAALEYGDIPGVPTVNWGTGESCLESELKKSRVPLGCVGFLLSVVFFSSLGGGGGGGAAPPSPAAAPLPVTPLPPPPPPAPAGPKCIKGPCSKKGNSSWDLDDGPCIDARDAPTMVAAYDRAVGFAESFYAFTRWKQLDLRAVTQVGRPYAAEADAASTDADRAYQFSLALVQLVGAFPDGHVSSGPLAEDIPDCGTAAGDVRAKLKHDHIGGGFGITLALLDNGQLIVTSVVSGSEASIRLAAGDIVDKIDGAPALPSVQAQNARGWMWVAMDSAGETPATTDTQLSEQVRTIARGAVGDKRSFTVSGARHAAPLTVTLTAADDSYLTWRATAPPRPFFPPAPPMAPNCDDDDSCAHVHAHMLSDGVTGEKTVSFSHLYI
jgi:hypothetical protein